MNRLFRFAHCGFKVVSLDDIGLVLCVLGGLFSRLLMPSRVGGSFNRGLLYGEATYYGLWTILITVGSKWSLWTI